MTRVLIKDFQLANPMYKGASVKLWRSVDGVITPLTATLYAALTGSETVSNPFKLDSRGKQAQPIYVEDSCIAQVSGSGFPTHYTGVISVSASSLGTMALQSAAGVAITGGTLAAVNVNLLHTASGAAGSYDFTGLTGYSRYMFVIKNPLRAASGARLALRVSQNNGVSYIATTDNYYWGGGEAGQGIGGLSQGFYHTGTGSTYGAVEPNAGNREITVIFDTASNGYHATGRGNGNGSAYFMGGHCLGASGSVNAVRFLYPSDTIASGYAACFGMKG